MESSRQDYWSGLPFPSPGIFPTQGFEPMSLTFPPLAGRFFTTSAIWEAFVYTHPLFFGFPSHLGHHRALSRAPCAVQSVLISHFIHSSSVHMSIPVSQSIPTPWRPYICSLHLCLYYCFVSKIIYTIILDICLNV